MKPVSMTRVLKPLLSHKKIIRKILKVYDKEEGKYIYEIYLSPGNYSCYDYNEVIVTTYDYTDNLKMDAHLIDEWLSDTLYKPEELKNMIENQGYYINSLGELRRA